MSMSLFILKGTLRSFFFLIHIKYLFTSKSLAETPLTLFSDVVLKLSRLFQIDALADWTLCYEQS